MVILCLEVWESRSLYAHSYMLEQSLLRRLFCNRSYRICILFNIYLTSIWRKTIFTTPGQNEPGSISNEWVLLTLEIYGTGSPTRCILVLYPRPTRYDCRIHRLYIYRDVVGVFYSSSWLGHPVLEIWGMWSTPCLVLLAGPLWLWVGVFVQWICQIELLQNLKPLKCVQRNYWYWIELLIFNSNILNH